jgi:hypothetical protein
MYLSYGASLIARERTRQIEHEGWTPEHDTQHAKGELALAGACYAFDYIGNAYGDDGCDQVGEDFWPWKGGSMKTTHGDAIRQLTKAGALIAAEIDRLHALALR